MRKPTVPDAPDSRPETCPVCSYRHDPERCELCAAGLPRTGPGFPPADVVRGFRMYFRGALRVVNDKAYIGKIAWTVALSLGLFVLLVLALFQLISPWIAGLLDWLPSLGTSVVAVLLTVLTAFFLFPVLITLFLFPVLDPLARIAEREALGFEPPPHARGAIGDFWDSLDTGARTLLYQAIAWLICLPLTLFVFGVPVAFAVSGFFGGFTWLDYPASRRGLGFGSKWRIAREHWALMVGYGLGFQVGLLIPFFNPFLVAAAGAVGAADLWFACDKGDRPAQPTLPSSSAPPD